MKHKIIASISAQEDNLGDIEIRKILLSWFAETGAEIHCYRGGMSDSYVRAFELDGRVTWHNSLIALQIHLLGGMMPGSASHFVLAPGPQMLQNSPKSTTKSALNLINATLCSAFGGGAYSIGRAFRGGGFSALPTRLAVRQCKVSTVRDELSNHHLDYNSTTAPDLAFYPERWTTGPKSKVAICVRSSLDFDIDMYANLCKAIRLNGLEPVVVVQVKRDQNLGARIADLASCEIVSWTNEPHLSQLHRVYDCYSNCAAVVSNRLHGLILGARSGAVPLRLMDRTDSKLAPTLTTAIGETAAIYATDLNEQPPLLISQLLDPAELDRQRCILFESIQSSRVRLTKVKTPLIGRIRK